MTSLVKLEFGDLPLGIQIDGTQSTAYSTTDIGFSKDRPPIVSLSFYS